MTTLPLATRLTHRLSTLLRPVQRRVVVAELCTLDERMLRDIGLSRIDVEAMRRMW